jgi:mannosyltransferase
LVAVPWLVLPPVILLLGSDLKPVYVPRYVAFCLPALALLAAAGLTAIARPARIVALLLVAALGLPNWRSGSG